MRIRRSVAGGLAVGLIAVPLAASACRGSVEPEPTAAASAWPIPAGTVEPPATDNRFVPAGTVYEVCVEAERGGERSRHVEWIDPASGAWRVDSGGGERGGGTHVLLGTVYASFGLNDESSLRIGSRRFLGPNGDNSFALAPLRDYLERHPDPDEIPVLRLTRGDLHLTVRVSNRLSPSAARGRRLLDPYGTGSAGQSRARGRQGAADTRERVLARAREWHANGRRRPSTGTSPPTKPPRGEKGRKPPTLSSTFRPRRRA